MHQRWMTMTIDIVASSAIRSDQQLSLPGPQSAPELAVKLPDTSAQPDQASAGHACSSAEQAVQIRGEQYDGSAANQQALKGHAGPMEVLQRSGDVALVEQVGSSFTTCIYVLHCFRSGWPCSCRLLKCC